METFSALLAICAENSPVPGNSPHKGQWRGALMFSLICVWINGWVNSRGDGDLRRYRAHYDVTVMCFDIVEKFLSRDTRPVFIHYVHHCIMFCNLVNTESTMKAPVYDILICWKWLGIDHNKYCYFSNPTLTSSAMDEKCNVHCPKLKISNIIYKNYNFLILRLKFPTTSQVSTISLWIYENLVRIQ